LHFLDQSTASVATVRKLDRHGARIVIVMPACKIEEWTGAIRWHRLLVPIDRSPTTIARYSSRTTGHRCEPGHRTRTKMNMGQPLRLAASLVIVSTATAFAQTTYVGADLVGDVLRSTHSESSFGRDVPAGGEAIGFALRVGTPLGSRWGVELTFTRPGEIDTEFSGAIPLASSAELVAVATRVPGTITATQLFPSPLPYRLRASQRHSTLSPALWFNQSLSPKISLVYLAGMGFYRTTYESESRFDILPAGITIPIVLPSLTKTVTYGVRPMAGFEARIELTDHVDLVPGVRLHGLESAWLLRPAVGLAWNF
jgi:hypothetical protein